MMNQLLQWVLPLLLISHEVAAFNGLNRGVHPYQTTSGHRPLQPSIPPSRSWSATTRLLSTRVSDVTNSMKDVRAQMESDEKTAMMMQALRGSNINDDAFSTSSLDMKLIATRGSKGDGSVGDVLPTTYQPEALASYFKARPGAVVQRILQVATTSFSFLAGVAWDQITKAPDSDVRRAAELRDTITSLGPFFIKLGQALSIRPDILSPKAMVELQQLCDKVPSFPSDLAYKIICDELQVDSVNQVFSAITPEPVAAASLGQVYKATLADCGDEVAVKVQRPYVLETVSLDLHLARELGLLLRRVSPELSSRIDVVGLLDEFASRFYSELDYELECENGLQIEQDMKFFSNVVIPTNYPQWTKRKVHVAEWIEGEKLSQSMADDVGSLVNLGVIAYLTQLLDTGFFHADPHPGNMLRTPQGELVILDFGLMTQITDDQKYGMIEAIAHLINRDYDLIGEDFVNLDFIPKGTDTAPIVPALKRVFDAALAGGGAKSINFQELAADLAEITFEYPFRIPPYFALVIRAIGVLEGIALVGNPNFAIVDEAYPYIARRLLTDKSPRMRAALRYMVYGKEGVFDAERLIDLLQALEKFVAVKEKGDGSAYKVGGKRGGVEMGTAGDFAGSRFVDASKAVKGTGNMALETQSSSKSTATSSVSGFSSGGSSGGSGSGGGDLSHSSSSSSSSSSTRDALRFLFSDDGEFFRTFILEEIVQGVDALSRDAVRSLALSVGLKGQRVPSVLKAVAPKLTTKDRKVVDNIQRLLEFFLSVTNDFDTPDGAAAAAGYVGIGERMASLTRGKLPFQPQAFLNSPLASFLNGGGGFGVGLGAASSNQDQSQRQQQQHQQQQRAAVAADFAEFAPAMRKFGTQIAGRLTEKLASRLVRFTASEVFGASSSSSSSTAQMEQQLTGQKEEETGQVTKNADGVLSASF